MDNIFVKRRENFAALMENGSMLVIYAGEPSVKRGDELYNFTPQRNFYYLTGLTDPRLVLFIKKNGKGEVACALFLERYSELVAKWDGAVLGEDKAKEVSGVKGYAFIDEAEHHLAMSFIRDRVTKVYLDMEHRSFNTPNTPELNTAKAIREKFPYIDICNAYPMLASLRRIKDGEEVKLMQKAVDITTEGYFAMLTNARPGMMEYELEAHLDYTYKKNGCKDRAFRSIIASGKNGTILHYGDNDQPIGDNDLVLCDFGASYKWYSADITRTFPVSGRFTDRQRQLYDIVLNANKKIIELIKPGLPWAKLNETVIEHYIEELTKIGLIKGKEELSQYYYHGVAHMLGLETHDLSLERALDLELAPGMVLTVEPGLYIAEEGIGIRIEDNILVTDSGAKVLTAAAIKEADDIEAFMAKR